MVNRLLGFDEDEVSYQPAYDQRTSPYIKDGQTATDEKVATAVFTRSAIRGRMPKRASGEFRRCVLRFRYPVVSGGETENTLHQLIFLSTLIL